MINLFKDPARLLEIARVLQYNGRMMDAIEVLNAAGELSPGDPAIRFQRALCYLTAGSYSNGWAEYDFRLHDSALAKYHGTRWIEGGPDGPVKRHLIVHGEQGIGDEIMFASCFPDVINEHGHFSLICDRRLHKLFRNSFPIIQVSNQDGRDTRILDLDHDRDSLFMMGSLARRYRADPNSFPGTPYLLPDPVRREFFKSCTTNRDGISIGLSWRGGLPETRQFQRSIAFCEFESIFRAFPKTLWYSLQYDERHSETYGQTVVGNFFNITGGLWSDWLELATFVSTLDLVIAVQGSIVHLCGALGVPCWALIPSAPEWRYGLSGETMPWYKSVKLYRQQRLGDWSPVLAKLKNDLSERINGKFEFKIN